MKISGIQQNKHIQKRIIEDLDDWKQQQQYEHLYKKYKNDNQKISQNLSPWIETKITQKKNLSTKIRVPLKIQKIYNEVKKKPIEEKNQAKQIIIISKKNPQIKRAISKILFSKTIQNYTIQLNPQKQRNYSFNNKTLNQIHQRIKYSRRYNNSNNKSNNKMNKKQMITNNNDSLINSKKIISNSQRIVKYQSPQYYHRKYQSKAFSPQRYKQQFLRNNHQVNIINFPIKDDLNNKSYRNSYYQYMNRTTNNNNNIILSNYQKKLQNNNYEAAIMSNTHRTLIDQQNKMRITKRKIKNNNFLF